MDQNNLPEIRRFIIEFFDDAELRLFAADYFRDVYNDFTTGMRKSRMVELLVEYCFRYGRIPELMAGLQRERERPFAAVFPNFALTKAALKPSQTRNPKQIFLSHAHQDAKLAHRLAQDLVQAGWQVWLAPQSIKPGEKWVEAIGRGLEESGIFLLLITPAAVSSRWVQSESNIAIELDHQQKIRFIPVKVKAAREPMFWRSYQQIVFTGQYPSDLQTLLNRLAGKGKDEGYKKQPNFWERSKKVISGFTSTASTFWKRVKTAASGMSPAPIPIWKALKTAASRLPPLPIAYLLGIIGLGMIAWYIWRTITLPDTVSDVPTNAVNEIANLPLEREEATRELSIETAVSDTPGSSILWAGPTELLEIDHFQGEITLGEAVTGTFQGSESDTWLFTTEEPVTVDVQLDGSAVESGYMRFFNESDLISTPTQEGQASEVGGTTRLTNLPLDPGRYMIAVQDALGNGRYTLTVEESEIERAEDTPKTETTPVVAESGEEVNGQNLIGYCEENPDHCLAEGNAGASIKVVEVTDYSCSFCRAFNQETAELLKQEFVVSGQVYWLILPVDILGPNGNLFSRAAATAALCLNREFPDFTSVIQRNLLMMQNPISNEEDIFPLVQAMGVDPEGDFAGCYENESVWQFVQENSDVVTEQGVNSVPFFAINKRTVVGNVSYETFRDQINRAIIDTINR